MRSIYRFVAALSTVAVCFVAAPAVADTPASGSKGAAAVVSDGNDEVSYSPRVTMSLGCTRGVAYYDNRRSTDEIGFETVVGGHVENTRAVNAGDTWDNKFRVADRQIVTVSAFGTPLYQAVRGGCDTSTSAWASIKAAHVERDIWKMKVTYGNNRGYNRPVKFVTQIDEDDPQSMWVYPSDWTSFTFYGSGGPYWSATKVKVWRISATGKRVFLASLRVPNPEA